MVSLEPLKKQEQLILEQLFQVAPVSDYGSSLSCSARDLLNEHKCQQILEQLAEQLGGTSLTVAASQFVKRYTYMVMVPALFAMSALNKGFDLALDNVGIHLDRLEKTPPFSAQLKEWSATKPGSDRDAWRQRLITQLIEQHALPLWRQLHRLTGVPLSILWENMAIYVYWLYETKLSDLIGKAKQRAEADFQYLLYEVPASLFQEKVQPLKRYYSPKCQPAHAPEPIRVRRTCCLYYKVGDTTCKTCPRNCIPLKEQCCTPPFES